VNSNRNFSTVGGIVAIIIAIAVIGMVSSDGQHAPDGTGQTPSPDIQERLEAISNATQRYRGADAGYDAERPREWPTSGPFQIDRSEYALGENVFFRADGMQPHERGQIAFLRPLNDTHHSVYLTFEFDGTGPSFNRYFTPDLRARQGICDIGDLAGQWKVVFRGTDYGSLEFTISDSVILPGKESQFEPVC